MFVSTRGNRITPARRFSSCSWLENMRWIILRACLMRRWLLQRSSGQRSCWQHGGKRVGCFDATPVFALSQSTPLTPLKRRIHAISLTDFGPAPSTSQFASLNVIMGVVWLVVSFTSASELDWFGLVLTADGAVRLLLTACITKDWCLWKWKCDLQVSHTSVHCYIPVSLFCFSFFFFSNALLFGLELP